MSIENGWAPIIMCDSDDCHRSADYALPQLGGVVRLVCHGHALGWFDEDSLHLLTAARRLEPMDLDERSELLDTETEPMTRGPQ